MHIAQTQLVKQPPLAVSNTPSGEASFQTAHVTNFDLSKKGQNGVNITLPQVGLTYCVFADGEFDPRKRTVVLQSAISGSPRAVVQSKKAQQTEGWFTSNIGAGEAGRLIDLKKFNVICFDYLGGNGTPELPNRGPGSALSLGNLCERITMQDSVNLQATILKRNFGLDCVSVVGGSFGGVCARKFLEQDIIQVDRVLDISSPGVHSSRAKNFFSTMRDVLERRVVGRAVTDDIDKLFGNLPGADLRGYRVAMGHVQRLFTKLDIQSASDHELMQAVRPFSFLGYIHPNGIHQRFEEHRDKSVTKSQSLRHWLNYHAETYANSVCPRATATLCRMISEYDQQDAAKLAAHAKNHGASIGRFSLSNSDDTLFPSTNDEEFERALRGQLRSFSTFKYSNNILGHDTFLNADFSNGPASNLKCFLQGFRV